MEPVRGAHTRADQPSSCKRVELFADRGDIAWRRQLDHRPAPKLAADHSGALKDGELARLEAVEAACKQRLQRGRDHAERGILRRESHELLEEEWIPLADANDTRAQVGC